MWHFVGFFLDVFFPKLLFNLIIIVRNCGTTNVSIVDIEKSSSCVNQIGKSNKKKIGTFGNTFGAAKGSTLDSLPFSRKDFKNKTPNNLR